MTEEQKEAARAKRNEANRKKRATTSVTEEQKEAKRAKHRESYFKRRHPSFPIINEPMDINKQTIDYTLNADNPEWYKNKE